MGSIEAVTALFLLLILGLSYGVEINLLFGGFKEGFGWKICCYWSNVRIKLESARLYKDDVPFLDFRPKKQGPNITSNFMANDTRMTVNCYDEGRSGYCYIDLEPLSAPSLDAKYKCEVADAKPRTMFSAEYVQEWFVSPWYAKLEVTSVEGVTVVNCSATGIPAPTLTWRIGEFGEENQKIKENFSNRIWNSTTKLWNSWSVVSVLRDKDQVLSCTATVTKSGRKTEERTNRIFLKSGSNYGKSLIGGKLLAIFALVTLLR